MDSSYISDHIKCTNEEKYSCMDTVMDLLDLAKIARSGGLVKLEDSVLSKKYQYSPLLRKGTTLIANGTNPNTVKKLMENYILSSTLTNKEFLESLLIMEAIYAIQQGENPFCIEEVLCSLFGIEFMEDYRKQLRKEEDFFDLSDLIQINQHKLSSFPKTNLLEFILKLMDNRSIQRTLREIPFTVLEYAILGSSPAIAEFFLKNISGQNQEQFFDDLKELDNLDIFIIEKSQREIINTIKKLIDHNEIILFSVDNRKILTQNEIDKIFELMKR